jgi:FkbM family methyltransferase
VLGFAMVAIKSSNRSNAKSSSTWRFVIFMLSLTFVGILFLLVVRVTKPFINHTDAKTPHLGKQQQPNAKYSFNPILRHLGFDSDTLYQYIVMGHPNPTTSQVVIEVGCFRLDQSMVASSLGFRTLSFDPSPQNFQKMKEQYDRLPEEQRNRMELYPKAVSDQSGQILEFASIGGTGDHAVGVTIDQGNHKYVHKENAVVKVATVALDDLILSDAYKSTTIFLLKIDVQGHEAKVFKGLSKTLKAGSIRYILFEYWVDALDQACNQDFGSCTAVNDILVPLVDAGYELFDLSVSAHPLAGTKVTHAYTQRYFRPLNFEQNCQWFASLGAADRALQDKPYTMGYWTDVLAVYKGELSLSTSGDMTKEQGHAPLKYLNQYINK